MSKHTIILPYRSIRLYIIIRINMSMHSQTFLVKAVTTVATLAIAIAITRSTITRQPFAFNPKHCNMYEPSSYNLEYNESQQKTEEMK